METKKTTIKKESKPVVKEIKKKNLVLSTRITEKAARMSQLNAYTFNVAVNATKSEIKKEIIKTYKVTPIAINTTKIKNKVRFMRGNWGTKGGGKKAVVYLKKGDTIAIA